jgi:hypothetical protein
MLFFLLIIVSSIECALMGYYCYCHHSTNGKLVVHYVVVHLPLPSTHHHHLPLSNVIVVLSC